MARIARVATLEGGKRDHLFAGSKNHHPAGP
jgi:hypothetical protein